MSDGVRTTQKLKKNQEKAKGLGDESRSSFLVLSGDRNGVYGLMGWVKR